MPSIPSPRGAPALSAAQRGRIRRLAATTEGADVEESKEINVVPFLDIITNVLMFVLATIAITFTATIDVTLPKRGIRPPTEAALDLSVLVVGEGFSVKARGGNVTAGCTNVGSGLAVPKRDGAYDYVALRDCAAKLKASLPSFAEERNVTVTASPQVPYDVLIATVDAVRSSREGEDLFPEVAFGVVR
jgi:biopolymer transport protein ExbD